MDNVQYIGFDIHKRTISYCVKQADGRVLEEATIRARRSDLEQWAGRRTQRWVGGMEATMFTAWIYDTLRTYAQELKVGNPLLMKAISAAKKKNDRIDARMIADLLRCNLLPECYMMPAPLRDLRQLLRYRNFMVSQCIRMQNRISGVLMEAGQNYDSKRLHGASYFAQLLQSIEVPKSVVKILRLSRSALAFFRSAEKRLRRELLTHPELQQRVERLRTIPGVGEVVALSWALEIGPVERFRSMARACSYCGLTSAVRASAEREYRGPLSKQRNAHLQTMLIEAAKLAPRYNPQLAALHAHELQRGNRNQATIAVARKMVSYLMAVDRSGQPFQVRSAGGASPSQQ